MFETLGSARRCCLPEVKLAMQFLQTMTTGSGQQTIEIGTPNLLASFSRHFLMLSQKSSFNIIIRGSHGKIYPLWALPDDMLTGIRDEFIFRVNCMVENLYHLRGAQGDSTPGTPPEILDDDWEQWITSSILKIIDVKKTAAGGKRRKHVQQYSAGRDGSCYRN